MNEHKMIEAMCSRDKAMVRELCKRLGYGAVMHFAEECWREDVPSGLAGAEHTCGPCATFMVRCEHTGDGPVNCDWCCGSGRVTKRVAQAMKDVAAIRAEVCKGVAPGGEWSDQCAELLDNIVHILDRDIPEPTMSIQRDGGGCDRFRRGVPSGDCVGDGHYQCRECERKGAK